ncbi:MAG: hypothetical protein GYA87_09600, partial [Christensenellaceae bacterium]|nr:hypothetical protein [Christensenellaceae bacterium]
KGKNPKTKKDYVNEVYSPNNENNQNKQYFFDYFDYKQNSSNNNISQQNDQVYSDYNNQYYDNQYYDYLEYNNQQDQYNYQYYDQYDYQNANYSQYNNDQYYNQYSGDYDYRYNNSYYYDNQNYDVNDQYYNYYDNSYYQENGNANYQVNNISTKKNKKSKIKKYIFSFVIILIAVCVIGAGGYYFMISSNVKPYENTFAKGVYVDGINLSGLSKQEGQTLVQNQSKQKKNSWFVNLMFNGNHVVKIDSNTVGIEYKTDKALANAWAVAKTGDIFQKNAKLESLAKTPKHFYSIQPETKMDAVDTMLQQIKSSAYIAPQSAYLIEFDPNDKEPFHFQKEVHGRTIDIEKARQQIILMLQDMVSGEVVLEEVPIQPDITLDMVKKNYTLLNRTSTPISDRSTDNRVDNIKIAYNMYNGMVLKPNEKFSFNSIVGARTAERGFLEAIEYAYGEEVVGYGGGVCQASTTTYLAAIQSGLKIISREAHSQPVSYTELGKDATVFYSKGRNIDLVFRNNTEHNIYITAKVLTDPYNKNRLLSEVSIYGYSEGNVRYELESKIVETLLPPEEPEIIKDKEAKYVTYVDQEYIVQKPKEGYIAETYLSKIVDGIEVSRTKISRDVYKAKPKRIYVGITERE